MFPRPSAVTPELAEAAVGSAPLIRARIPNGSRVRATRRLADTSPQSVLQAWLNAASAELGLPDEPCPACLTVLHELSTADGPLDLSRLAEAVRSLASEDADDSGHPDAARFVESIAAATGILPPAVHPARSVGLPGGEVYQLKITLRGVSKPPVWRRVAIPAALTLDLLHEVIQQVMGWEDGHMHMFSTPGRDYGVPGSDLGYADEGKVTLAELLVLPRSTMRYTYDFGDGWEHDIMLEKILPPDSVAGVSCLAGKGACPPEDCGGAWGYASLKEVLADPDHGDHDDLLDWLGLDSAAEFDLARFSLDKVNAGLSRLL